MQLTAGSGFLKLLLAACCLRRALISRLPTLILPIMEQLAQISQEFYLYRPPRDYRELYRSRNVALVRPLREEIPGAAHGRTLAIK